MNKERIEALVDFISLSLTYDQTVWAHEKGSAACGSPACIAGHAVVLAGGKIVFINGMIKVEMPDGERTDIPSVAENFLEIRFEQREHLFMGMAKSKQQAIRTLRHFAKTEEINWEI